MKHLRKPIVIANWKMNKTGGQAADFAHELIGQLGLMIPKAQIVICPPFTALESLASALSRADNVVALGAQNMHPKRSGAFTGEISAEMLRDLYVSYVLIGHSERRTLFAESDAFIHEKIVAAFEQGLKPILCIGETLAQHEAGLAREVLTAQIESALASAERQQVGNLIIAYEPVWAIGTGRAATPELAEQTHAYIRTLVAERFGDDIAHRVRIVYGGSVTPSNAPALFAQPSIDGGLVGGASLEPRSFYKLIQAASLEPVLT